MFYGFGQMREFRKQPRHILEVQVDILARELISSLNNATSYQRYLNFDTANLQNFDASLRSIVVMFPVSQRIVLGQLPVFPGAQRVLGTCRM